MAWRGYPAALILEDDVKILWHRLDALGAAVRNTSVAPDPERLTVLFSSSYAANGDDALRHGVHLRPNNRFGNGLMPAVGVVVTAAGAHHLLQSLPITDNNDALLSDRRGPAARQPGLWYSKPYTFVPASELQHECMAALEDPSRHCRAPGLAGRAVVPSPRPVTGTGMHPRSSRLVNASLRPA